MYKSIKVLHPQEHGFYRYTPSQDFYYAKKINLIPITFSEVKLLCCEHPVVIIMQEEQPRLMVMTGLEKNDAVNENGKWKGKHIPSFLKRYPFTLVQGEDEGTLQVGFDLESGLFSSPDGHMLFTEEGTPTEILENITQFLTTFQQESHITDTVLAHMHEKELLQPAHFNIRKEGEEEKQIGGFFTIDKKKFLEQEEAFLLDAVKNGWMELIELHHLSLSQINKISNS